MALPVLSVGSQNSMRNICLDLKLHVEDSRTFQIDCLQEMNIKTQVNAKRRKTIWKIRVLQWCRSVHLPTAVCHSTARQKPADWSTAEMTGRYSRLETVYSKKRVTYTKRKQSKHRMPDAKGFLWQTCESCSVYVIKVHLLSEYLLKLRS
jgi:hypothetical protein